MKSADDRGLYIAAVMVLVLLVSVRCCAAQYMYKGVYPVEAVMVNLCENCFSKLPPHRRRCIDKRALQFPYFVRVH